MNLQASRAAILISVISIIIQPEAIKLKLIKLTII